MLYFAGPCGSFEFISEVICCELDFFCSLSTAVSVGFTSELLTNLLNFVSCSTLLLGVRLIHH